VAALKRLWAYFWLLVAVVFGGFLVMLGLGIFPWKIASIVPWTVPSDIESSSPASVAPTTKQPVGPGLNNAPHPTDSQTTVKVTIPEDPDHPLAPQYRTYDVQIPDTVIDRLTPAREAAPAPEAAPAREAGLTSPKVALIAAGVTIVVALITLSGVWKTVKDKWTTDRIGDVWDRFIWLVDPARAKFLSNDQRREILAYLERNAGRLRDIDLKKVVDHWRSRLVDSAYDDLRNATEKAIPLLAIIRDDKSVPAAQRQRADELHHSLTRSLEPFTQQEEPGGTRTSTPTSRSPAPPPAEMPSAPPKLILRARKPMDEATAAKLAVDEPRLATLQSEIKQHIQTALAAVAETIPDHVDDYAKTIAYQQHEMTNYLAGANKLQDLRDELKTTAEALARRLIEAAPLIRWRAVQPASAAVSEFLTSHVRQFDDILKSHGYYIGPRAGISPGDLFNSQDLDQVGRKLDDLFAAEHAADDARAAKARATVGSLWP
jgi:hypothetical protein